MPTSKIRYEKRNKILMIGGFLSATLLGTSIFLGNQEDKVDPKVNLKNLKNQDLISDKEYQSKIIQAEQSQKKMKEDRAAEKLAQKTIQELKNLREKGILSQTEFETKIKLLTKNSE